MNTKYTSGPWTHEGHGDITGIENDPENGCVGKVDVACVYLRTVPGRHEANARLIAAAPELLEALKETLAEGIGWFEESRGPYVDHLPWVIKARAAIAKATEGQK